MKRRTGRQLQASDAVRDLFEVVLPPAPPSRIKATDTAWFITKARAVHGNRYEYSKVVYLGRDKKVCIGCPEHEDFWQTPANHVYGKQGCPTCGQIKQRASLSDTAAAFAIKANAVHGDRYGYRHVKLFNHKTPVKIECPAHGIFEQTPDNHLGGKGCTACGILKRADSKRGTTEEFIARAHKLHKGAYNYTKSTFTGRSGSVEIGCPDHGFFWQSADNHLQGAGCPICGFERTFDANRRTLAEFIVLAQAIHGDRYGYSEAQYKTGKGKIAIVCPAHGQFLQNAENHLRGSGCPACAGKISKIAIAWLDHMGVAEREVVLPIISRVKQCRVDGFDAATSTVYLFHGDFWHGNPARFRPDAINPRTKTSFGELYRHTLAVDAKIRAAGYNLITIWERDWMPAYQKLRRRA